MHRAHLLLMSLAGILIASAPTATSGPPSVAEEAPPRTAKAPAPPDRPSLQALRPEPATTPIAEQNVDVRSCAEMVAAGEEMPALLACRDELEYNPGSPEMMRLVARLEFDSGDPLRSAELWQRLIDREGWSYEAARAKAMAVWRGGAPLEAETIFRQIIDRSPTAAAHEDLVTYLLAFDRCVEAAGLAAQSAERFPEHCWFQESVGVAEACQDHHAKAAEAITKAIAAGCPRYAWTQRGALSNALDRAEYRPLLRAQELAQGLRQLDDNACRRRMDLLKPVMSAEVAPAITDEILERTTASVRFAGLGLLSRVGSQSLPSWKRLLASDDFLLRKYTLRRIREQHDPAFIPLVEEHLEREPLPKNKNLTRYVLGDLLLGAGQIERGEALLWEIPEDDLLFPVARLVLSERAEAAGDDALALKLVDQAKATSPTVYVDPQRVRRLREVLSLPAEGNAAATEATTDRPGDDDATQEH